MNNTKCISCAKENPVDSKFCLYCGKPLQETDTSSAITSSSKSSLTFNPWYKDRKYQIAISTVSIILLLFLVKGFSSSTIYENKEYKFTIVTPADWKSVNPTGYVMKFGGKVLPNLKVIAVYEVDGGECVILVEEHPNPIESEIEAGNYLFGKDAGKIMTVDNKKALLWNIPDYDKKGLYTSFSIYNNGRKIQMKFLKSSGLSDVRKTQESFDEVAKSFKFN